ncbi:unnamed protein product [Symbiodinium natans]|uniref:Uncharacterized protein n=1 Tax=Symbiodinium natans TaxID=878477 RepID=A0A812V4Z1_9DINO|nr:unnamed protein product [Symbiodinium natans]
MTLVGQEHGALAPQPGKLIMRRGAAWQASSGAKLRLSKPVPVPRTPSDHPAQAPEEEDLGPLAPKEAPRPGKPSRSQGSWEPSFQAAKASTGYRAQRPPAGAAPSHRPGTLEIRRWQWPTGNSSTPVRGPGPPLPGTLAYASDSGPEAPEEEPLPWAAPEDDAPSDAEAPPEAPAKEVPSGAEASDDASENDAPPESSSEEGDSGTVEEARP